MSARRPIGRVAAGLAAETRLVRAPPSQSYIKQRSGEAQDDLASAERELDKNVRAAFRLAYDALRAWIDVDLNAHGYRLANMPGAHIAQIEYAEERFSSRLIGDETDVLVGSREARHATLYGEEHATLDPDDATNLISLVQRVRELVIADLVGPSRAVP